MFRLLPVLLLIGGCAATDAPPPLDAPVPPPASPPLRLAGDDAATPLIRHLVQVFESRVPGPRLIVDAPLGAHGARAALADGLLGGALVVEPAGEPGAEGDLVLARSTVGLVVGPGVRDRRLPAAALTSTLNGDGGLWPGGLPRRLALRPASDPIQRAFVAGRPDLSAALNGALDDRRWPIVAREAALREALRQPGVMAIADRGNLRLHGSPTYEVAFDGPVVRVEFRLVPTSPTPARLQAFIRFATGDEGQSLIADLGFESAR